MARNVTAHVHWVIGDIHGMLRPLETLLAVIENRDSDRHFVFVGDYINRGPSSRQVVDLLLSVGGATFCRGNHDDVMQLILTGQMWVGEPARADPLATFAGFLRSGLDTTLLSYGVAAEDVTRMTYHPTADDLLDFARRVPEDHRRFFLDLVPCFVSPGFFAAHAYWPPREPVPRSADRVPAKLHRRMIWERFDTRNLMEPKAWDRPGLFGHSPVQLYPPALRGGDNVPINGVDMVLLDTGAFRPDGRLSAVCADTGDVIQVHRTGDLLTPT